MDSTEKQRSRTSTSTLFDSSNNLYNNNSGSGGTIHPLHEIRRRPSPSLQSDTMSQSSNNNTTTNEEEESGLCSVFEKLKTDDQRRNSSPGSKLSEDMLKTASHRSMSVDVGSVHNPNHYQKLNSASSSTTTRTSNNSNNNNNNNNNSNNNTANSTNIQNLLSKNLLFDGEAHQSNDMFPTTPRNDPYFRSRYAGSTEKLSSPLLNKDNNSNNDNASTTSNSTTTTSTSYNGLVKIK
ncbi:hypothetical protein BDC45DRAFT_317125 [Circinella umbellata]|nr:hypothetical protein BDC45DRAFT_317125 [Circinella umbellata]